MTSCKSIRNDQGIFIHIDGIDGAGKSTLLQAARHWAEEQQLKIFDCVAWSRQEKRLPLLEEVGDADVLLTAEPTHAGIGSVIREEIIRAGSPYSARFTAHAFALDRGVQYTRLVLPFLQARPGRWVIQDRGILSSLAYQPLQSQQEKESTLSLSIDELIYMEGNRLAIQSPPDIFIFLDIDPDLAQERLSGRTDKQDNDRYSTNSFQTLLAERYRDPTVCQSLTSQGTTIIRLDGAKTQKELGEEIKKILAQFSEHGTV